MNNILKILAVLSLPLLLNACGGGGGGSAGGAASYTVPSCTDSGTRDTEYLFMGKYSGENGLTRVCASAAYARDATGNGIKVAVLDTGITVNGSNAVFHTELDANVATFTSGSDLIGTDNVPNDEEGHGSHVAGIIAGENNGSGYHGVAYDATLYIYKVLNDSGSSVGNSIASGITKARGAKIYAEITGYGATSDGYDMVAPSGEGAVRCMQMALKTSKNKLDYINTHGTSTPVGDITELKAVSETFKNKIPKISSTKSLSGHPLGAASVHEAIYCLIMMKNNFITGSANISEMDEEAKKFPIVTKTEKDVNLNAVMSNSFGFGGTNATLIFEKV